MRYPTSLHTGDKVAITATSSPVPEEKLEASIASIRFLGLEPVVMPSCYMHHGYLAGKDRQRADDLNKAFSDPDIKGIFCLRGGYGTMRLLPLLDYEMIKNNPKVFIGYSDITGLHTAINKLCHLVTFHGPMPTTDYRVHEDFTLDSLKTCLFAPESLKELTNPGGQQIKVLIPGTVQGVITGGNLSLLAGLLGSPYEIDTKNKILFIEDVDEEPYRIDRNLTALSLAGKFRDCAGIILGTFERCEEKEHPTLSLEEVFTETVLPWNKPTILNFRAGHIYPQSTFPMGAQVRLDAAIIPGDYGQGENAVKITVL